MNTLVWTLGAFCIDLNFRESFLKQGANALYILDGRLSADDKILLNAWQQTFKDEQALRLFDQVRAMICKRTPCPPPGYGTKSSEL